MQDKYIKYIENLNYDNVNVRLENLRELANAIKNGEISMPVSGNSVNNHIHTTYSFSPYSPTKALWMAYNSGLKTAGIMDHDSLSGAREFIEAGRIIGMATTIGVECRADCSNTLLNGKRINNPDQKSVAYMAIHGIPHTQIEEVVNFFKPYVAERNNRNKRMIDRINGILKPFDVEIDFEMDVVPLSKFSDGGSITERHLLFSVSQKLVNRFGKGAKLVDFLTNDIKIPISKKVEEWLLDTNNVYYEYDLLGALKSEMVEKFYIDAAAECPDIRKVIDLSNRIGGISAYAYLGDIGDSVTGDKKTQKFEDDYIDLLFEVLKDVGFKAVTYMPSRNSLPQLKRLKGLCDKYGFFQISGEDINSPRQSFICKALENEEFKNLIDATWALIGHEIEATNDLSKGMFSKDIIEKYPAIEDRINLFKEIGLRG